MTRYREQAGIWAVRAGEGRDDGTAYTLFGPGKNATHISAPVGAVSEKEAAPFLEMTGKDFFTNPDLQKIITPADRAEYASCRELTAKGDRLMEEARRNARETERQKMVVNTTTGMERRRAEQKVKSLLKDQQEKRLQGVACYQEANDREYALNRKYILALLEDASVQEVRKEQGRRFHQEAERGYRRARELRGEAGKNPRQRYDRLMEANAYEMMSLDRQRKAILTLTGLMPASEKDMTHVSVAAKQGGKKKKVERKQAAAGITAKEEEKVYRKKPEQKASEKRGVLAAYPFGLTERPGGEVTFLPASEMPPGVNYRLQVGVFSREPDPAYFRGMYPLFREPVPGKDLTRYYAGQFRTYGEAVQALLRLRRNGYPDAVLVAFRDGRRERVDLARELEDDRPYSNLRVAVSGGDTGKKNKEKKKAPVAEVQEKSRQTPPASHEPSLIYRVQVGVFSKPLPPEKLHVLEELAGWDHVVIRTKNNLGYYIYAIGNFATFEEAATFRDRLLEQGLSGCFVTAYRRGVRVMIGDQGKE